MRFLFLKGVFILSDYGIFKKLKKYLEKEFLSVHMPGHKSGKIIPEELRESFGSKIFEFDITEIEEMDNLQNPQGIIKETEEKINNITGGRQAFLLVNGSTAGILAAIYAIGRNMGIFAGGNCHQAVYNGMILAGSSPIFLPVDIDPQTGVELGVSPETLEKAIKEFPEIKLLILTMPNYYGFCYRYEEIMTVAKRNKIKIIIDEAHGAHFNFLEDSCPNGIKAGGDIVVQSWHKTLPVFNQGSILLQGQDLEGINLRESINMFQTTSPSYLIMSTLDKAADYMSENRQKIIDSGKQWKEFFQKLDFQNLRIFSRKDGFKDPFKILFSSEKKGRKIFKKVLLEKYQIQPEIIEENRVLLMLPLLFDKGLAENILKAFIEIDALLIKEFKSEEIKEPARKDLVMMTKSPMELSFLKKIKVPLEDSLGKICGQKVLKYPPGIPLVYPGEILQEEIVCYLKKHKINYSLQDGIDIFTDQEN